jgi:Outer membrane protein beta-barrel domain
VWQDEKETSSFPRKYFIPFIASSVFRFHHIFHAMKQLFYFFSVGLMVTAFVGMSHAQTMMIGVRGGVNLANEQWEGRYPNSSISPGILAGAQIDYWFNRTIAASIQILFDQKGDQAIASADGPPGYNATWTGNYIELPLFVKVNTGEGALHPYFFVGPSIGFLISNLENGSFDGYYGESSGNNSINITDSTNKIDLSIVVGGGVSFTFESGIQFIVDVAYAVGLLNSDNYSNDRANGIAVYSRDIRVSAGMLFPLN